MRIKKPHFGHCVGPWYFCARIGPLQLSVVLNLLCSVRLYSKFVFA